MNIFLGASNFYKISEEFQFFIYKDTISTLKGASFEKPSHLHYFTNFCVFRQSTFGQDHCHDLNSAVCVPSVEEDQQLQEEIKRLSKVIQLKAEK